MMREQHLVREFLDLVAEKAENDFRGKKHLAFVAWYIEAEFGRRVEWHSTDDSKDGGVDAVGWRPDDIPPVVIIQSKFTEKVGRGFMPRNAYKEFRSVVEAFRQRGTKFEELVNAARDELRPLYRKAFDKLGEIKNWGQEKKAFRLISTAKRSRVGEFDLIPRDSFIYAEDILRMYRRYRRGQTPTPPPLQLAISDKMAYRDPGRNLSSYLFNARLSDFLEYFRTCDVARLVARNIRYNLGGRVGKDIRLTYEKRPKDFWYYHNGLTIVCDNFWEEGGVATLTNPSVVNGAQTLYAISGSRRTKSPAIVAVRAIVRGEQNGQSMEDDEWLQGVIRGVNTQNRVRAFDFSSNEPEQVELQDLFREVKVFYERKRGEWREFRNDPHYKGFERISLRDLALILTAISEDDGEGAVLIKRGIEKVFEEKHYRTLFPSRSKIVRRFKRIYLAYRLYRALIDFGYADSRTRRRQRHAFWNVLWLMHLGISAKTGMLGRCSLHRARHAFDSFEDSTVVARHARKIFRTVTGEVWKTWRRCRKSDPEHWTANNFFKVKFGNTQLLRLAMPRTRAHLKWLGTLLNEK